MTGKKWHNRFALFSICSIDIFVKIRISNPFFYKEKEYRFSQILQLLKKSKD